MSKKKVLHLLTSNKYSGAENVVCTIIEKNKKNYDFAYCSLDGEISEVLKTKKVNFYPLTKLSLKQLNEVIESYKPDIIHAHDYKASILASYSKFDGKIISHLHNNCPDVKTWTMKSILYSLTIKKYNNIVGVSQKVFDEAVFNKKMANKFIKIYNFVDKNKVIELSKEKDFEKTYDIFFIGRLVEQKDPNTYIEIINQLKKDNPNIKAVMIGDGELMEECKNKINELNLYNNIDMLGFCENPFPIINNCKIGIMPSKWEGFGLTAIEAMCLNKPVFNSGVGGLGEIFCDNNEYICDSIESYVQKTNKILKKKKIINEVNISNFVDEEIWKEKIVNLYK